MWNSFSHKQIISRCVATPWPQLQLPSTGSASALCSADTRPPLPCQVWQIGVSRQQGQGGGCHFGSMDTPAHPPVGGRGETKRKGEGGGSSWAADDPIMNEWMGLNASADRRDWGWQSSGRLDECSRGKYSTRTSCCQTNKHLKYQETKMAATPCEHYSKTKSPIPKK